MRQQRLQIAVPVKEELHSFLYQFKRTICLITITVTVYLPIQIANVVPFHDPIMQREGDFIIISVLQIWKLRLIEVNDLPKVTQLSKRRTNTRTQLGLIPNSMPFPLHHIAFLILLKPKGRQNHSQFSAEGDTEESKEW